MAKWDMGCPWCNAREGEMHAATCKPPTFGARIAQYQAPGDDGYDCLRHVLALALQQANAGKGKERHANGKPFDRQPIMEIG